MDENNEKNKNRVGEVWRKPGPCGVLKIVRLQFFGEPDYDGGLT